MLANFLLYFSMYLVKKLACSIVEILFNLNSVTNLSCKVSNRHSILPLACEVDAAINLIHGNL